jgi:HK97 family phage portal protein
VGLGLATEQYGARFFGNDSRPGGVLATDRKLDSKTAQRIKASWQAAHSGLQNSHRVAVLEQGLTWQQIGLAPEDAQFLETRKFQTNEIARLFRVPPHMIGDLDRATFSNIEHQSLSFVIYTLLPWLVKWEQSVYRDLLSEKERLRYQAKLSVAGLLRGDAQTRAMALATMRQNGVINADEWRVFEEMNPIQDGSGQIYLVNGNMVLPGSTSGGTE